MPAPVTLEIWLLGANEAYGNLLSHQLGRNPDYQLRRFTTSLLALANAQIGSQPDAIIFDCGPTLDAPMYQAVRQLPQADINMAVELMHQGATNYLLKDVTTPERLWHLLGEMHQPLLARPTSRLSDAEATIALLGDHPSLQRVRELIAKAARTTITVSITGETGTGKELVAQAIHAQSSRAGQPFVAMNMAAIPRELLESELFSHEKGAFTGAAARRVGHFEAANGGTLFLDEIGDLELGLQAKLLRVLQERVLMRVGSTTPVPFNVRLVVATHRDLAAAARAGYFREDLYYRLLGLPIERPPLRARGEDLLLLANHFLHSFSRRNYLPQLSFEAEAQQHLLAHDFPGNVRELRAVVELAAVLAEGQYIRAADLPPLLAGPATPAAPALPPTPEQRP